MKIKEYSSIEEIGSSLFSTVYKANNKSSGKEVVLRVISSEFSADAGFRTKFEALADKIKVLHHPNLLPLHDAGVEGDQCYVVTEPHSEGTLRNRIRGYTDEKALPLIKTLAKVLEYLHQEGLSHLRIRPGNIYFSSGDEPVLGEIDMVQALLFDGSWQGEPPPLTAEDALYYCPEQKLGSLDFRSDFYQLGLLMHELFAKSTPFQSVEADTLVVMHSYNPAPRLPPYYSAYQKLVDALLAKDPKERVGTYSEFLTLFGRAKELAASQAVVEKSAAEAAVVEESVSSDGPSSAMPKIAALVVVVVLLVGAGLYMLKQEGGSAATAIPEVVQTPPPVTNAGPTDAEVRAERAIMLEKQRQLEEKRRLLREQERKWLAEEAKQSQDSAP